MGLRALRRRHRLAIVGWVREYIRRGHRVRIEARHGPRDDDNEVVFRIADWPAFVEVMEPSGGLRPRFRRRLRVGPR